MNIPTGVFLWCMAVVLACNPIQKVKEELSVLWFEQAKKRTKTMCLAANMEMLQQWQAGLFRIY